jgi:hypothetical protein
LVFKAFKYFEKDNIPDNGTYEDSWSPTEDRIIKRIYLARKDGASFTKSTFYFKIDAEVYTLDVVPCNVLGPDMLTSPVLDIPIRAKSTLMFSLKNLEGSTISVMVTLELYT